MTTEQTNWLTIPTAPWAAVTGTFAQAQALGVPAAIRGETYWNAPELPGHQPGSATSEPIALPLARERLHLKETYGITDPPSWVSVVDERLRGRYTNTTPGERALDIRETVLDTRANAYLDLDDWIGAVHQLGPLQGWTENETALVTRAAVKAFHIERQLVEDDLLPAGDRVWTYLAVDLDSVAALVQSGFRLGYIAPDFGADVLMAARENAANIFQNWSRFGASYAAGRSARHGSYPCDTVYLDAVRTVRTLLHHPESPWVHLPFPAP